MTHYIIVRTDLPVGCAMAQLIHAAGESAGGDLPNNTIAVALGARDEDHLEFIEAKLRRLSIPHHRVREPDRNNELTAIGLQPVADRRLVRRVVGSLPLFGREPVK